jgi:hypothetical protein
VFTAFVPELVIYICNYSVLYCDEWQDSGVENRHMLKQPKNGEEM